MSRVHILRIALLIILSGCAHISERRTPAELSTVPADNLGTLGFTRRQDPLFFPVVNGPQSKSEASQESANNAMSNLWQGGLAPLRWMDMENPLWWQSSYSGPALAAAVYVILTPVVGIGGALFGALSGVSEPALQTASSQVNAVATDYRLFERIAQAALKQLQENPNRRIQPVANYTSHESLAADGIETVLILEPLRGYLHGELTWLGKRKSDPQLTLVVAVKAYLVRTREHVEAGTLYARYESAPHRLVQWTADHGQPLRSAMDAAVESIASQIDGWMIHSSTEQGH